MSPPRGPINASVGDDQSANTLTGEHTMSSRHRKTTATARGVNDTDLSHGGVTAAELFDKFQSGQHLRDGRPTAESTQSKNRRRNSPARSARARANSPAPLRQESVSARLAAPKHGTLFQQAQAEQEAVALAAVARAIAAATKQNLTQNSHRATNRSAGGVPGFAQPKDSGRRSRAATPPPAPKFQPDLGCSFAKLRDRQQQLAWDLFE